MYEAYFNEDRRQWRIKYNDRDLCGTLNEFVARETAIALTQYRRVFP